MSNPEAAQARPNFKRSPCPISNTLDILGDKWTLLVIRDLFLGKHRFKEFTDSPERIPTNILADRLKRLEAADLVVKEVYQERPVRYAYALSHRGSDLLPVLIEIIRWANRHIPGTAKPSSKVMAQVRDVRKKATG